MPPLKPPRPHAKVKTPPPSHAQQEAQAAAEEAKIHEHLESADEDLASMVYTQASEVVIQNLGKVLEAINKREHRNYPVIKFSTDIERVLKEKAEEIARRDGTKSEVWFLKPYCEMGRCMINRLRYDRSLKLIEVTDACDAKLVVAKLAGEAGHSKKKAAAAAATTADAKKRKRQEQLIKKGLKPNSKMGGLAGSGGGSDISPTSVTNLDGGAKKRKRLRPMGGQGEAGVGSDDDDAPVTDLLSSKRKLKLKGGGAPANEHRKSVSSVASAGEGTVTSAATAGTGGGGGGGNRIVIKKPASSLTKFKIPVKGKGGAGNGAVTMGMSSTSSDGDSNDPLRLREKAKEEKLKKAQELVNEKRRREAEEEERQKEVQEKKLLYIKNQKEHLKKQEEHRKRKVEEERRKYEKEQRDKAARRKRAREEREGMKRTIDFDADQRALEELQRTYHLNPFGTNMTRQIDWEAAEGEVEPYQGENNYYRPPMIRA